MTRKDCPVCGGDGHVSEAYNDTQDTGPETTTCPACNGGGRMRETGRVPADPAERWVNPLGGDA